jgi:Holliday junction resolvasome RuvABC endonuclease subunit
VAQILAVDPGFASLGYVVVQHEGGADTVREMGIVETKPAKDKGLLKTEDQFRRLRYSSERLWTLAEHYEVDAIAFESLSIPQQTSKQNAIKIGHPYGMLGMLAAALDIAVVMMTPQAVKKALCGKANASKADVEQAVKGMFSEQAGVALFIEEYPESKRNHGWDALAAYVAAGESNVMKALKRSA